MTSTNACDVVYDGVRESEVGAAVVDETRSKGADVSHMSTLDLLACRWGASRPRDWAETTVCPLSIAVGASFREVNSLYAFADKRSVLCVVVLIRHSLFDP